MTYAETALYYENELVFMPEEPPRYGAKVFECIVRDGWMSPNKMYGAAYHSVKTRKRQLFETVWAEVHKEPVEKRAVIQLSEPRPRILRLTVFQRTGPLPDVDNLVGGFKHLIDVLKRMQYTKVAIGGRSIVKIEPTGIGLIWDDPPQYVRIGEIHAMRPDGRGPKGSNYVLVEVFEWPATE